MSTKNQKLGVSSYVIACLLVLGSYGVNAETIADKDSLSNRLKEFNGPDSTEVKVAVKKSSLKKAALKKRIVKSKTKKRVVKRRRYKRACYKSSASTLRDRADSFQPAIKNSSRRYGVSEALIISVITAESCFHPRAKSHMNARGLMQLIPATARRFGVKNSYVPSQNIKGGTRYLKFLLKKFSGNLHHVIAAYNAGEGAVDRYSGIPPYRETKEYVRRVMSVYRRLQGSSGSTVQVKRSIDRNNSINTVRPAVYRGQKPVSIARSSTGKGYFIKPDYQWKRKPSRARVAKSYNVSNNSQRKVSNNRKRFTCRDVSSQKLRRTSRLVKRGNTMKRYYSSQQPRSLSSISKTTGVGLNLLLRMNRSASRYMVKPGSKILVWQCANR